MPGIYDTLTTRAERITRACARSQRPAVRARGRRAARGLHPARDGSSRRQAVRRLPVGAQAHAHPQEAREGAARARVSPAAASRARPYRSSEPRAERRIVAPLDHSRSARSLRLVFAGTPPFAVPALDALAHAGHEIVAVYTQPDRPAGRGRGLTASAVKQRALERQLVVEQPASLKIARRHSHACASSRRHHGRRRVRPAAAGRRARDAATRLHQHSCIAAAALARCRADPARDRWPAMRRPGHDHADGCRARHGTRAAHALDADRCRRDERCAARPALRARCRRRSSKPSRGLAAGTLAPQPQPAIGRDAMPRRSTRARRSIDWRQPATRIDRAGARVQSVAGCADESRGTDSCAIWSASTAAERRTQATPRARSCMPPTVSSSSRPVTGALSLTAVQLPGRRVTSAADFLHAWRGSDLAGQRLGSVMATSSPAQIRAAAARWVAAVIVARALVRRAARRGCRTKAPRAASSAR